jgi:hypothetical protein
MPTLVVYVPFTAPQGAPQGDIRQNAEQLAGAPFNGRITRTGAAINNVLVVYANGANHQVQLNDIVCVHAHGGSGADTDIGDNLGETTTQELLLAQLDTLGAALAQACYFAVCFSAEDNHAARVWKRSHPHQTVLGASTEMQGAIVRGTRTSVRSTIFDANNDQLHLVS